MTPKEKARDLVERYHDEFGMLWYTAKKCALITVDEIMFNIRWKLYYGYQIDLGYWQQVENEIDKL